MDNNIIKKVMKVLHESGIIVNDINADYITDNNVDSVTFIETIVNLEEEFDVLVPDEYLVMERVDTVQKIADVITEVLSSGESMFE